MKSTTLKALKSSIEHWKRLATGKAKEGESVGVQSCALCMKFYYKNCVECPVYESTGKRCCRDTPFHDNIRLMIQASHDSEIFKTPEFKEAAKKELDFLVSLLPSK